MRRLVDGAGLRLVGTAHPAVFGLRQLGHATISVEGSARRIADEVAGIDETSFVATTASRFAVTAELRATDLEAFSRGLDRVRAVAGVRSVQALTYLRVWKNPYFPPDPLESSDPLDEADHLLNRRLQANGRASYVDLAATSGLSPGAARARVLRLLDSRLVHVGALVRLSPPRTTHTVGFALTVDGETNPVARKVVELDEVDCLATGLGWCNAIGSVRAASQEDVFDALGRLRALPGVRAVESWTHLRAIKEEHDLAFPPTGAAVRGAGTPSAGRNER